MNRSLFTHDARCHGAVCRDNALSVIDHQANTMAAAHHLVAAKTLKRGQVHGRQAGNSATATTTASSTIQYGIEPRKISPSSSVGSVTAAFTVNTRMPNGGVKEASFDRQNADDREG